MSRELENMLEFNIYAGLSIFGDETYQYTTLCESLEQAESEAYNVAIQEYQAHEGTKNLKTLEDIALDLKLNLDNESEYEQAMEAYTSELDNWVRYGAVLTSEDSNISPEDIIRDYTIVDEEYSEG